VLFWLLTAFYLADVSATLLVLATMKISWLPFVLVLIVMVLALLMTLQMEDTRIKVSGMAQINDTDRSSRRLQSGTAGQILKQLADKSRWAANNWKLMLAVALFPLMASRGELIELVLPYASTRFGFSLREVSDLDWIQLLNS
jgi:choline-glycine betaine transporter